MLASYAVDPRLKHVAAVAAAAIGAGWLLDYAGLLQPDRPVEFSGLILVGIVLSALAAQPSVTEDRATMPPSFVIEFTALLIFGAHAALVVAIAGAIARGFAHSQRAHQYRRTLMNVVTVAAATQAAGFAHIALGGTLGHFEWPMQGIPIAAALVAYCFVKVVSAEFARPLLRKQPVDKMWPARIVLDAPIYFTGAGVAVGLVEIIDHSVWALLPVAAIPLYCALRTYSDYVNRLDAEHRRREVIESLDQGMCVVDNGGRLTLWNDSLERIAGVRSDLALGDSLVGAMPVLGTTELPKVLTDALKDRTPRTIPHLRLSSGPAARILQVKLLPVSNGMTLLWQDVTERTRSEQALRRSEERLSLCGRWIERRMVGVEPSQPGVLLLGALARNCRHRRPRRRRSSRGLARSCASRRRGAAERSVESALVGQDRTRFKHEHRLKREDGSYRWFLCRGVAGRTAGRNASRIAGSLTDTTDRALVKEGLRSAGFRDPLTGLRSRADFVEGLGRRLQEFKQPHRGGGRFAILYLDLDRFKVINDSLGHLVGDELLIAVSRRLESCLRDGDALARLGGDEFAILLQTVGDEQQANVDRVPDSGGAERAHHGCGPRGLYVGEHRHLLRHERAHQPRRDHARRRHRHVSREGAWQGAARDVRCRHARAHARPARSGKRSAPRRQQPGLRSALSADRPARDGDVRRVRIADSMDAQRQTRIAGDVRPHGRGAGPHRAARHVGAPAGMPDVCGVAAEVSGREVSITSPSTCRAGS